MTSGKRRRGHSDTREVVVGGAASFIGSSLGVGIYNPLDVLRVRWQTEANPPRSLFTYARQAVKQEGMRLLWRGVGANMLAIGVSSGTRIGLYPVVRDELLRGREKDALTLATASMGTGMLGYALSSPLYQVKVRLQAPLPHPYPHLPAAMVALWRSGFAAAWRGSGTLALRGGLFTCGQMLGYDTFKTHAKMRNGVTDGPILHATAAVVAAFGATTLHMPADVIYARYHAGGAASGSPASLAVDIVKREGPLALMRGWSVAFGRILPLMVTIQPLIEQVRKLLGIAYID